MDFDFSPGFKAELGLYFTHDNWQTSAMYTRYYTKNKTTANVKSNTTLQATWLDTSVNSGHLITNAKASWHIKLDMLDINFMRPAYWGYRLIFNPIFGLKAFWIDQRYNATYTYDNSVIKSNKHSKAWNAAERADRFCSQPFYAGQLKNSWGE